MNGRPLIAFALVMAAWTAARVILWTSPFAVLETSPTNLVTAPQDQPPMVSTASATLASVGANTSTPLHGAGGPDGPSAARHRSDKGSKVEDLRSERPVAAAWAVAALSHSADSGAAPSPRRSVLAEQRAIVGPPTLPLVPRRWLAESWLLYRPGKAEFGIAGPGLLGGSQAGVALRYRLGAADGHHPAAYLRASGALQFRQQELAAGLSVRPVATLPVRFHGEARAVADGGGMRVRPAAFITSELPPVRLPAGTTGDFYVQAGYVGGRDGTAFVDAQAQAMRDMVRLGAARIEAGVGAWGSAQDGANRLDLGPSLGIAGGIGGQTMRLRLDYRKRIAGNAQPGSGPVVTLTHGF